MLDPQTIATNLRASTLPSLCEVADLIESQARTIATPGDGEMARTKEIRDDMQAQIDAAVKNRDDSVSAVNQTMQQRISEAVNDAIIPLNQTIIAKESRIVELENDIAK